MIDSLYIAWQYVRWNRGKTLVLITSITLIAFLPLALQIVLQESEHQLQSRAVNTPLLIGAKGSALDLVMNSLYFDDEVPQAINMQAIGQVEETGLAQAIPLYVRFQSRGFPIVGTSLDYFDFRQLQIEQGRMYAFLGETVIGADVAERLAIVPGGSLVSSPDNLFDIAGVYPLKMKVSGVLARSHSPDDLAIFVDLRTAWVIQGFGHGHQDLVKSRDATVILNQDEKTVTANAKLLQYTEISEDNIESFHFHGDESIYPITAVLAQPHDDKSSALLRGRYLDDIVYQVVKPDDVIEGLMENIFRIKNVINAVIFIVGIATVLTIVLVFILSLRIRRDEMNTIFRIGCSRMTTMRLLAAEILIILLASALLCTALLWLVKINSGGLVRSFIL